MQSPEHGHEPVMLPEVLAALFGPASGLLPKNAPSPPVVMDCTVGRGGHASRIAQHLVQSQAQGGTLICLDVDPENLKYARHRIEEALGPDNLPRLQLRTFQANFGEAPDVLAELDLKGVDALLADFGVSTNQLLDAKHGLSFNAELALDMRLDPRIKKKAADLLADWDEKQLAQILHDYAQERFAWKIARKITLTRATEPIKTTGQLARLVRSVVPPKWGQIDPATRTFQALRMAVNQELEAIEQLLAAVPGMMNPAGRASFISFHSGEDRLVKQAVRRWEEQQIATAQTKKPLEPSEGEMQQNPRSRSAKMRGVTFSPSHDPEAHA